jgi:DNA-binding PadR family transcriptional regulator
MEALLNMRAALLLALSDGPGYGVGLIEKVRERTLGQVRLGRGNVYPALRALEAARLVRSWKVIPGGRRGARARVYYELTPKGVGVAQGQKQAVSGLLLPSAAPLPELQIQPMSARIRKCSEVSAFVRGLRGKLRRASA